MRYFSTFSGIGGFELGIQSAYMQSKAKKLSLDADQRGFDGNLLQGTPSCVGFSEIDKYASSVYEYNFPGAKNYGDITKINAKELPDFDCLVGGFPCQAFSIAGKRQGFADTRGTLFFDLARILAAKKPRLFVFENVKGLLSHDDGNTFKTIIATIDELGYDCQWQVLNSKNHGVPQNRERIYIVGHLRGTPRPEVFPITGTNGEDTTSKYYAAGINNPSRGYEIRTDGLARTVVSGESGTKNRIIEIKQPFVASYNRNDGIGKELDVAHTLSSSDFRGLNRNQNQNAVIADTRIRRLTPKECERLQGFPDDWTKYGKGYKCNSSCDKIHNHNVEEISDTQRYKMCGNAVTTNVVQEVFERIFA